MMRDGPASLLVQADDKFAFAFRRGPREAGDERREEEIGGENRVFKPSILRFSPGWNVATRKSIALLGLGKIVTRDIRITRHSSGNAFRCERSYIRTSARVTDF